MVKQKSEGANQTKLSDLSLSWGILLKKDNGNLWELFLCRRTVPLGCGWMYIDFGLVYKHIQILLLTRY
jgi:hypothetical protein